jgi:hypothetical protein
VHFPLFFPFTSSNSSKCSHTRLRVLLLESDVPVMLLLRSPDSLTSSSRSDILEVAFYRWELGSKILHNGQFFYCQRVFLIEKKLVVIYFSRCNAMTSSHDLFSRLSRCHVNVITGFRFGFGSIFYETETEKKPNRNSGSVCFKNRTETDESNRGSVRF